MKPDKSRAINPDSLFALYIGVVEMQVDGACHCGAITFTAVVEPNRVMVCHCTDCQVLTGSAFRVVVPALIETFVLHGEPKRYVKVAESGAKRTQAFCSVCGSPVFATAVENATQVSLRVGLLRQRNQLSPSLQIWKRSASSWLNALASVPGCEQQEAFSAR
jgi:hypothetical protein